MPSGFPTAGRVLWAVLVALLLPVAAAQATTPAVPAARRLHVTVTLNPRNPGALAAYARAVSTPGSADFRRFLTPAQFRARFGASPAQVSAVLRSLRARGLQPGPTSAGGLSIPVTATAGRLRRAFSIPLAELALPGRRATVVRAARRAIGSGASSAIQSIIGLDSTPGPHPLLVRGHRAPGHRSLLVAGHSSAAGAPQACAAAQAAAPGQSAYTADQIASAYGFSGLYGAGDGGQGVTVAVYELESDSPSDIAAYQACYGTHATISYVPVDGGAGTGAGSGEAALDIENLIGLAPDVNVLVYQGPNSSSSAPGSGPYDTFSTIINQDRASVISVSWGECEAAVGQADAIAENDLFEQAAVQGESVVAADGDSGAEDCDVPGAFPEQTQAAVDDPSSQPFVTGVGGTSLTGLGPRPSETVWNSGPGPLPGDVQPGAGGGGVSSFWQMPAAQLDAASFLGVRSALDAGPACGYAGGWCRAVPDVSADADPTTGYLIYWNGNDQVPGQPGGWQGIGGTSAAAPVWAALLALADANPACDGTPVGYADPALYRAAGSAYAADFNDVTSGDNDFTGTNGGRFAATPGYDLASGLGTPSAGALVPALCANGVTLTRPTDERTVVHAPVDVALHAHDATGAPMTFAAVDGLPPGLRLNATTGVISGRPSRAGRYTVRISVHDDEDSAALTSFDWVVGAAPQISRLSLASTGRSAPTLTFTISAGRDAPALETVVVTPPRGLRVVAARRGVTVKAGSGRPSPLRFRSRVSRGTLVIALHDAAASARVTVAGPMLRPAGGRTAQLTRSAVLEVTVTDAAAGVSKVTARVR